MAVPIQLTTNVQNETFGGVIPILEDIGKKWAAVVSVYKLVNGLFVFQIMVNCLQYCLE